MTRTITRKPKYRPRPPKTQPVILASALTCDEGSVLLELLYRMNPPSAGVGGHE